MDFLAVTVDNTQASVPLTTTITLSGSIQQSSQFQTSELNTEATAYTQSFSVKADLDLAEVMATVEESQNRTSGYTSGTASTQTWDHDIQTQVTVPAGKKYTYQQRVNYGQVTVPYTATARSSRAWPTPSRTSSR